MASTRLFFLYNNKKMRDNEFLILYSTRNVVVLRERESTLSLYSQLLVVQLSVSVCVWINNNWATYKTRQAH